MAWDGCSYARLSVEVNRVGAPETVALGAVRSSPTLGAEPTLKINKVNRVGSSKNVGVQFTLEQLNRMNERQYSQRRGCVGNTQPGLLCGSRGARTPRARDGTSAGGAEGMEGEPRWLMTEQNSCKLMRKS